jgi:hypothetical protein
MFRLFWASKPVIEMPYTPMAELDELISLCGDDSADPIDPLYADPEPALLNLNESPAQRIREMHMKGVQAMDIARVVGRTHSTVRGHLFRMGLVRRRRPNAVHA